MGNGTAGSCTSHTLEIALGGGGAVTFNCPAPYTIVITSSGGLLALGSTTVDGANSGNRMTLNGNSAEANGGSLFIDTLGVTTLTNVTISGNSARQGGGIYNGYVASLWNVTLSNNSAATGVALFTLSGYTTPSPIQSWRIASRAAIAAGRLPLPSTTSPTI